MTAARSIGAPTPPIATWRAALVIVASCVVVGWAGSVPPTAPGARELLRPTTLTAGLWTLVALAAAWPGRAGLWQRAAVAMVGMPAAFVLARVAIVPPAAELTAWALVASTALAGELGARAGARGGAALALVWIGAPAVGHAAIELGLPAGITLLLGSPLVAPTVLAHAAPEFAWYAALPALCVNVALAVACTRGEDRRR